MFTLLAFLFKVWVGGFFFTYVVLDIMMQFDYVNTIYKRVYGEDKDLCEKNTEDGFYEKLISSIVWPYIVYCCIQVLVFDQEALNRVLRKNKDSV